MKRFLWLLVGALVLAGLPAESAAQTRGTIVGQIVDATTSQPLASVQVFVPGTSLGTLTDVQGRFSIANVPAGTVELRANRVGYAQATQSVTVASGATATVDLSMSPSAVALDELVVTGTTGVVERRSQGAVVASIDASDIVERGTVTSVQDILTGRVPGVQLTASSGSTGTAQQIRIRGASSISLSNEPLIFIDGVRADSRSQSDVAGGGLWVGGQATSRLFDVNPEDIESVEVVKGPAAATLYGADASAGVIQIFTKKGAAGTNQFRQNVTLEYHDIDPNFTPETAFGRCTQALVDVPNSLCAGRNVDDVFTDNVLQREGVFRNGQMRSLGYNARGGGDNFGYYISFGVDQEDGTLPTNEMLRRTGRANFNFTPTSTLSFDAGVGITDITTELPMNDNNVYGYLGLAYLGSPSTVRVVDGERVGGTYSNRPFEAINAIESSSAVFRVTPTVQVNYTPFDWFSNRVVVGGDITRGEMAQYFPINSNVWYQGDTNTGDLEEIRTNNDVITFDYLGTIRGNLTENITSNLSFGAQAIRTRYDRMTGSGVGFVTTGNRVIGDAAQISASQGYADTREIGFLGHLDLGFYDRLYLQLGARIDQNSSFGEETDPFFLPSIGASYVISDEQFWDPIASFIPSFRVRAKYGTTGRSPTPGASLETYNARPYAILNATGSAAGVVPFNPGTLDLKPEKGTEYEFGFDAGFFNNRLGLELTYFDKTTTDLLIRRPVPPSTGAGQNPYANLGEVTNTGFEFALNSTLVSTPTVRWEARLAGSTLDNELVDLGGIEPFGTVARFDEGHSLGFLSTRVIREVITAQGDSRCPENAAGVNVPCVIVSDQNEYFANSLPTYEGNFGTTLTLFNNFQISGQLDWKGGNSIYNNTAQFRERSFGTAEIAVDRAIRLGQGEIISDEDLLRRWGPFVAEGNGSSVAFSNVHDAYYEKADFVRLRELSATYFLPASIASRLGASNASLTVGGRNLGLWTDYSGPDPEVLSAGAASVGTGAFVREDFLTVPQPRRLLVRMNLSF